MARKASSGKLGRVLTELQEKAKREPNTQTKKNSDYDKILKLFENEK